MVSFLAIAKPGVNQGGPLVAGIGFQIYWKYRGIQHQLSNSAKMGELDCARIVKL